MKKKPSHTDLQKAQIIRDDPSTPEFLKKRIDDELKAYLHDPDPYTDEELLEGDPVGRHVAVKTGKSTSAIWRKCRITKVWRSEIPGGGTRVLYEVERIDIPEGKKSGRPIISRPAEQLFPPYIVPNGDSD